MMTYRNILFNLIALALIVWIPLGANGNRALSATEMSGPSDLLQQAPFSPEVRFAEQHGEILSLGALGQLKQKAGGDADLPAAIQPIFNLPKVEAASQPGEADVDPLLKDQASFPQPEAQMPAPSFNFDGLKNSNNVMQVLPPDANGDIGPEHYVQWVNSSLAVWRIDRTAGTASLVLGPQSGNLIWASLGKPCGTTNDGDPIVLYDHLAGRWLVSQFSVQPPGPFYQCIAISRTSDPTGGWHLYAYKISDNKMNDYPHFGVWEDGYYLTVNQFFADNSYAGAAVIAFERQKMLVGGPAQMVLFDLYNVDKRFGGMLPSDLDGPPPPAGTPNYVVEVDDSGWIGPADALRLWEFHVDWSDPRRSTFGLSGSPNITLPIAGYTPLCPVTTACIPQRGTSARLDDVADRLMYRLQYRSFGSYGTLVSNFTVDAGSRRAGIRWFELRSQNNTWSIHQQGTYAGPAGDSDHRWMASAALDKAGNLAIGFSIASSTRYPSIRYAGRLAGDPLGGLTLGEASLVEGGGSQTNPAGRWGDYSNLAVDPYDDCTFWFTSEYYPSTTDHSWSTRIGAFALPSCQALATGKLQGRVIDVATRLPLAGALVRVNGLSTQTDSSGIYQFLNLPVGVYSVQASIYGYGLASAQVEITANVTQTQDLELQSLPKVRVSGIVSDGSGQGWPLYARLQIDTLDSSRSVFTNPDSGVYEVELTEGVPHTFKVSAVLPGYSSAEAMITPTPGMAAANFTLAVNSTACQAPGYEPSQSCAPLQGGLLVGNVYDAMTGSGINGATVMEVGGPSTAVTLSTPDDPQVGEGFFTLFSSNTGPLQFTARREGYGSQVRDVSVALGAVAHVDFSLPAGRIAADREGLSVRLSNIRGSTYSIILTNTGTYPAAFNLAEVNAPLSAASPTGPFAAPSRQISPKHLNDLNASFVYDYTPPEAPALPAGQVLGSWPAGLAAPWGVGYNANTGELWLSSTKAGGGEDRLYPLSTGPSTGLSLDLSGAGAVFAADLAFNPRTGKLWQVWVGSSNCLVEIDPGVPALTGGKICPSFGNSQRGLAYNPLDDTYYSGSWNSTALYHFDASGAILDSLSTGLNISGLAFNPSTRHLFVLTNGSRGFDVYVLDTAQGYEMIGGFDIAGLEAFQAAGLEMDCDGHLWAVDQAGQLIEAESGEKSACAWNDIPWLSASPASGSLLPGESVTISVEVWPYEDLFSAGDAVLEVFSSTPYSPLEIPVHPNLFYETILPYIANRR